MERNETKELIQLLGAMFQPLLTGNKDIDINIIDVWHINLRQFTFDEVKIAISQLGNKKVYGKVQPNDIVSILKPPLQDSNIGAEFADRLISLNRSYGAVKEWLTNENGYYRKEIANSISIVGDRVLNEYGAVGYDTYLQLKEDLRVLEEDNISTFKAQVRNVFNSKNERMATDPNYKLAYNDKISQLEIPERLQIGD